MSDSMADSSSFSGSSSRSSSSLNSFTIILIQLSVWILHVATLLLLGWWMGRKTSSLNETLHLNLKSKHLYQGFRNRKGEACVLRDDGKPLAPCHHLKSMEAKGFDWGWACGGSQQLSLAILYDFLHDSDLALSLFEDFDRLVVSRLSHESFRLKSNDIAQAIMRLELSEG